MLLCLFALECMLGGVINVTCLISKKCLFPGHFLIFPYTWCAKFRHSYIILVCDVCFLETNSNFVIVFHVSHTFFPQMSSHFSYNDSTQAFRVPSPHSDMLLLSCDGNDDARDELLLIATARWWVPQVHPPGPIRFSFADAEGYFLVWRSLILTFLVCVSWLSVVVQPKAAVDDFLHSDARD
jgi:hypothetical protein